MSRRGGQTSDDDIGAFRRALEDAGVKRLTVNRANPGKPRNKQQAAMTERRAAATAAASTQLVSHASDGRVEAVRPSEFLDFAVTDLPYRTHTQLKRGRIPWEAGLDLHGYNLDEARTELERFLHDAAANRARCVLIVHGKSRSSTNSGLTDYPVIKSHVNAWLREWPSVLAFCSAREPDGGTGAVYVLLRRRPSGTPFP
ncbi:Smr/MutS family protein [Litchfieldella rifensis]|uniref:Smr/MutS family protein n=1 Tax=Litchfieldella rifensis TaxID=762643 RepID=A0ABV7LKV5_9GAMM